MLSRKRPVAVSGWMLLLLALACAPAASAQANRQQPTPTPQNPPTITLTADNEVVTLCPDNVSVANPRVRLRAVGNSPDGNTLRYRWTTSGGRIEGDGTDVVWDLSNAPPGVYSATVTVESGPAGDPLCTAFTSTRVVVRNCPPPRPFCPNVSIYCPDVVQTGAPVTFTANISGGTPGITPVYNWKVSAGTITSGQGTSSITVDTAGLGGQPVTASLEVEGYNLECRASCQSSVRRDAELRSTKIRDVKLDEEKALLDLFAIQLQNEPGAQGYIIGYAGRKAKSGEGQRRANRARDYLVNARGIEATRIVVHDGGYAETNSTELWVVPPGATPPRPR